MKVTSQRVRTADSLQNAVSFSSVFRIVEDVYYQHSDGHLDPHRWRGLEAVLRDANKAPGVQAWWRSHSHYFDGEEFVNYINQLQQTAGSPRLYREPMKDE